MAEYVSTKFFGPPESGQYTVGDVYTDLGDK